MFLEPPRSEYDLHFKIFGLPVRVHPLFWLIMGLFGMPSDTSNMQVWVMLILCWVAAAFIAILVHELGHALVVSKYFGARTWIVLYGMGGLTIHDRFYTKKTPTTLGRIAISAAGPFAGFAFAACIMAALVCCGVNVDVKFFEFAKVLRIPAVQIDPESFKFLVLPLMKISPLLGAAIYYFLVDIFFISIFWGLLNLLPIFPLDGGQISKEIFSAFDMRNGAVNAIWLSVILASAIAMLGMIEWAQVQK
ncbi:MAG: site-2 protease family protein, partial [Thermoguttaceae bacterium]